MHEIHIGCCKNLYHKFFWLQFLSDFGNQGLIRKIKIFYMRLSFQIFEKYYFICKKSHPKMGNLQK